MTDAQTARREALEQASEHYVTKSGMGCSCGLELAGVARWQEYIRNLPPKQKERYMAVADDVYDYGRCVAHFEQASDAIAYAAWRNREARDGV